MRAEAEIPPRSTVERFDQAAARYESWYETVRGARIAHLERLLLAALLRPLRREEAILEVGCGTGYFAEWLEGQYGNTVGLDESREMLRELQRRRALPIVRGDAHRLPFGDGVFGPVVFVTTLEFLDDPERALREAVRVARSQVVVLWLNPWSLGALKRRFTPSFLLSQAQRLSVRRVREMLGRAAGSRARQLQWASTLFPGPLRSLRAQVALGDVCGMALSLAPPVEPAG